MSSNECGERYGATFGLALLAIDPFRYGETQIAMSAALASEPWCQNRANIEKVAIYLANI